MKLNQTTQPKPAAKKRGKYLATRYGDIVRYESNSVLYLHFKHKGKRYEYSLETALESVACIKADAEIKAIKARVQEGALVSDGKITLGELLTHFLSTQARRVEAHEIKRRTYEAVEDGVKKIRREQAPLLVREAAKVSFKELDDYVHKIRRDQSPTTVNKVVDAIKTAYAIANENHLIAHDPSKKLKQASIHAVKSDVVLSDEEYAALIQYFQDGNLSHKYHVIDLVEFLRFFGLRINEARQVLKTDVDLQNRVLRVRKEIAKNGVAREVPIFDEALPLINRLLARKNLRIYGKEVRTDKLLAIGKCYGA
jgi:site-specific recombinase XerD